MLSWQYIAGFMDGEGTVTLTSNGKYGFSPRVELAQSGEIGLKVLGSIQDFLVSFGISSTIHTKAPSRLSKLPCHSLKLTNRDSASRFLKSVVPYLITKKVEAQDLLRYIAVYPSLAEYRSSLAWETRKTI